MAKSSGKQKFNEQDIERLTKECVDAGIPNPPAWILNHEEAQHLCGSLRAVRTRYNQYSGEMLSNEVRKRLSRWSAKIDGFRAKLKGIWDSRQSKLEPVKETVSP